MTDMSYASITAANLARASRTTQATQTPNTTSFASLRPGTRRLSQMAREERQRRSSRDEDSDRIEHSRHSRAYYDARRTMFFTPSYLRGSRHLQRFHDDNEKALEEARAHERAQSSMSSTTNSIHPTRSHSPDVRMHRGVAHNVVERRPILPLPRVVKFDPIPSAWDGIARASGLEILGEGTEVRFSVAAFKNPDEAATIRANYFVPRELGIYYYEVTILSRGKDNKIGIGFGIREAALSRMPGWEIGTYGWHGDDGDVFSGGSGSGKPYGPRFSSHDVIGCGINLHHSTIFYTKNGVLLGTAFKDIKNVELYPSIGMKKTSEHIRANFGRSQFVFDIDSYVDKERAEVMKAVDAADVSKLHPPDDESALIQNLVGQYLAHEGFIETSRAFQRGVAEQRRLAPSSTDRAPQPDTTEDDIHTSNRQQIRRAVLDGDIDRALKQTHSCFPHLLTQERNKPLFFQLRCRKFIEMMRRYSDLSTALSLSRESLAAKHDTQHDTQMELDEQLHRETADAVLKEDTDMDTTDTQMTSLKQSELLAAALDYGRSLRADFGEDSDYQHTLNGIFALMAYEDPKDSPVGDLLDTRGRASIAEALNGAILVSLGKPPSAALEGLCTQTERLLDEVTHKVGGPAAFLNVRQGLLKS